MAKTSKFTLFMTLDLQLKPGSNKTLKLGPVELKNIELLLFVIYTTLNLKACTTMQVQLCSEVKDTGFVLCNTFTG